MKKAIVTCAGICIAFAVLSTTVSAHGNHGGSSATGSYSCAREDCSYSNCTGGSCTVEGCTKTGNHIHGDQRYHGNSVPSNSSGIPAVSTAQTGSHMIHRAASSAVVRLNAAAVDSEAGSLGVCVAAAADRVAVSAVNENIKMNAREAAVKQAQVNTASDQRIQTGVQSSAGNSGNTGNANYTANTGNTANAYSQGTHHSESNHYNGGSGTNRGSGHGSHH